VKTKAKYPAIESTLRGYRGEGAPAEQKSSAVQERAAEIRSAVPALTPAEARRLAEGEAARRAAGRERAAKPRSFTELAVNYYGPAGAGADAVIPATNRGGK
jgi:hypothetical protein